MALLGPDQPYGNPAFSLKSDQVDTVLDLVCRGVDEARQHVTPGMLEVPATIVVRKAIRRVKRTLGLTNLQVRGEHEVDNMATNDPAILGRIDITLQFLHQFGDEDAFVAIECKRVAAANHSLNASYVTQGVDRFASGKYAAGHHWGFMLGFVLALPVDTITTAIDQRIQKAYGTGAALAPGASHPMALAVFENALAQASDHTIRLRHIFVDMLAAAPNAIYPNEGEG
ncbi:hypothetical protein V5F29_05140 [Xanthobacter aminoxidans]|uniref:hypothetical protein n=1 Tax=Xanthobacter aminoxidans TaxID=186280 RepID=UPI0037263C7C